MQGSGSLRRQRHCPATTPGSLQQQHLGQSCAPRLTLVRTNSALSRRNRAGDAKCVPTMTTSTIPEINRADRKIETAVLRCARPASATNVPKVQHATPQVSSEIQVQVSLLNAGQSLVYSRTVKAESDLIRKSTTPDNPAKLSSAASRCGAEGGARSGARPAHRSRGTETGPIRHGRPLRGSVRRRC